MRKLIGLFTGIVCLMGCSEQKQLLPGEQLLERLQNLQQKGYMAGHQDDPFYGVHWSGIENPDNPQPGRSDVLESVGDYPAVMGFDLGGIEMKDEKNLDSVPFTRIHDELIAHHERGGIVTLSWHPRNPLTGGTAWDTSDSTVVRSILPGGSQHEKFMQWINHIAAFLSTLTDSEGHSVPIIFRPWHENNGSWFWWGQKLCSADEYHQLWNLLQDTLCKMGFNNLLWSYSPNLDGGWTEERFLERYPGNDRVALIGEDAYQWGTEEDYVSQLSADLDFLSDFAHKNGKLIALTECGMKNMPEPSWYTKVLQPVMERYPLSYFLLWRNASQEFFGPVPGEATATDFQQLVGSKKVLMLKDINGTKQNPRFVGQHDGRFWLDGKEYRFVGTNFWYGPILASEGQGGDRQRLCRELDRLHGLGLDNLRILVGSDGQQGIATKVEPTLQKAPGEYNDTLLAGLDFLLAEMGKRQMKAVLYLNNSWEWSGGYGYYLEQAGLGAAPRPNEVGYEAFMKFVAQFATNERAQQLFFDYVRFIVSRQNRYTSLHYKDDPVIMAWQIGNEPRAFGEKQKQPFAQWLSRTSALIRSIDGHHLISVGSEGIWGCEMDSALYQQISSDPNIDYLTAHIWPYNWGWVRQDSLLADVANACKKTADYLSPHIAIANRLHKPLVIEEFGFPRDGFSFSPSSPTEARNQYYGYVFSLIDREPAISGCNFWAWGGEARPRHEQWLQGDPYMGDPAQEQQGLNSVFDCDTTTLKLIGKK